MATAVEGYSKSADGGMKLTVYNLPYSVAEVDVHSIFPTAQYVAMKREQSQNMCVLQFNNPYDCQTVYAECQGGKMFEGRQLRVEMGDGAQSQYRGEVPNSHYGGYESRSRQYPNTDGGSRSERHGTFPPQAYERQPQANTDQEEGFVLHASNLPYSASEQDIQREFPDAYKVVINLDERGKSRGVAQLFFSTQEQCNAAHLACNYKQLAGRPIRGRIIRNQETTNRQDYGSNGSRDSSNRQFRQNDHGSGFRDRENRFSSGGGGRGFGRDRPRGFNRDNRPENYGSSRNRDRSPGGEPVRGYGSNRGPRITSAVITRPGGRKSDSSSDEN